MVPVQPAQSAEPTAGQESSQQEISTTDEDALGIENPTNLNTEALEYMI